MCYEQPSCQRFWFNPVEGTDGCRKPRIELCPADDDEEEEDEDDDIDDVSDIAPELNFSDEGGFWE